MEDALPVDIILSMALILITTNGSKHLKFIYIQINKYCKQ